MKQLLIIKRNQSELEWQQELSEALVHAEELCKKNSGRAPWGCQCFEAWRVLVEKAVALKQTLCVFYFEGKCGKGEMEWQDLCSERARDIARTDTGLGGGQIAEVAYLCHNNIPFEKHDVKDFCDLIISADLSRLRFDLGLASSTKRIAFHGKINPGARDCIASFPGKYNELWHKAVQEAEDEASAFSLACVFLTDEASGLGQHASVPHLKGGCWCHTIYGDMPPLAYLSVVDVNELKPGDNEQEVLDFKFEDAKAMKQLLIIKRNQSKLEWQKEFSEALFHASELCKKNNGRAPWGCQWFEAWRMRVEEAVRNHQTLHVFYFESKVGQGKMKWEDLCNEKDRKARKDPGLGESQTAEVAYLTLNNIDFEEHDILDFEDLMFGKRASSHTKIHKHSF